MAMGIDLMKSGIDTIYTEAKGTVFAAAEEVKALKTTSSEEYANAILGKNGFGGDTAEIYFFDYAPKNFPRVTDRRGGHIRLSKAYKKLMEDPTGKSEYDNMCFSGWKNEIQRVQEILGKYGGAIIVDNRRLPDYLMMLQGSGEIPDYRVHVRVVVQGQRELRLVEELQERFSDILH